MASQILFKVMCPSCEAAVPIRDESRIGKKVECPKCKFRFVVEEPSDDNSGEARPAVKRPAKKKSNTTMIIGIAVGTVAVIVLCVVGYLMISGDDPSSKPIVKSPPPTSTVAKVDPSAPVTPANDSAEKSAEPGKADEKSDASKVDAPAATTPVASAMQIPPAGSSGDISNLLPGESMSVVSINMDKLRFSTLGEQLFESKIGFRPGAFKEKLGIAIDEMVKFVRGENPEQKWSFNVIRTAKPVNVKELERVLQPKAGAKSPIRARVYYELPPNALLDNLASALRSEAEQKKRELDKSKKDEPSSPLGLVILDETTVVIATIEPLEQFLNDNAKPLWKTRPVKSGEGEPGAAPGGAAPDKPRGGRGMNAHFAMGMSMQQGVNDDAALADIATFLTVDPELKAMIDRLERDLKSPPILTAAAKVQADPSIMARIQALPGLSILSGQGIQTFGIVLTKYDLEKFYATVALQFFNENNAQELEGQIKKLLPNLGQLLGAFLGGIKVETEGGDTSASSGGGGGGGGGRGGGRGAPSPGGGGANPLPGVAPVDDGPASKLRLSRKARYVILEGEMNTVQRAHDRIYAMTESVVAKMRGAVEMASPTPLWKEFSLGLVKLYEENSGTIPRGTYQLKEGTGGRMSRNWPPNYRVSWMAALLPHLGKDDLFRQIHRDKGWRDPENLKPGSILVPEFLDPRYPERSWYAHLDTLGSHVVAATHYVGISGIGLEAGDYKGDDPGMAKKLGVFGYERTTSIKDVSDGVSNTIYVIEVPPNHQRPWIAGGGATVVGVPEQRSIRPFVNRHKDKRGTYVIMLDGSVRFIAENVSDEVFKSLCTIKGGESIEDLEKVAPKVKPGTVEMKTTARAE